MDIFNHRSFHCGFSLFDKSLKGYNMLDVKEVFKVIWCTVWTFVILYRFFDFMESCSKQVEENKKNGTDNGVIGCAVLFYLFAGVVLIASFWYLTL